ncbi:hypothetical protein RRG08_060384 [Elysia crispata]|uniref:Uncharacterized protein n=1 Tax=Elysia crispata TaxID=231223 RepID=A0AAE0ZGN0_9GAST|nr:hypothetical protein RRG08_060384 [Elysia crispata]
MVEPRWPISNQQETDGQLIKSYVMGDLVRPWEAMKGRGDQVRKPPNNTTAKLTWQITSGPDDYHYCSTEQEWTTSEKADHLKDT